MTRIPRMTQHHGGKPSWWPLRTARGMSAILRCPNDHATPLDPGDIDEHGFTERAVECRYEFCDWADSVQLMEWMP